MNFGAKLKELRIEKKITQLQMAEILDTSKSNISKYESGSVEPNLETLAKISNFFDVSMDYLLRNEISKADNTSNRADISDDKSRKSTKVYVLFFDDILKNTFMLRLKEAMAENNLSLSELSDKSAIDINNCKAYLAGEQEPSLEDLINLSNELEISTDYLLGQIPKVASTEKKLLNAFVKLNEDNKDIIIGKTKELLKEQQYTSVAADESLKKTGTDNQGK